MAKILVIMAAGMGSRFGGDKQTAHLGPSGEILMEYSVYDAIKTGFDRIIFVIRPGMESELQPLLQDMEAAHPNVEFIHAPQVLSSEWHGISISESRRKPLGTVHALLSASEWLDAPFAVINADDYYGRDAFRAISEAIDRFESSSDAAMVAYSLKNTLSRYGAVTRGICSIENGFLQNIRESYKVMSTEDGGIVELIDGTVKPVCGEQMVSMNMWAFHHGIIPHIEEVFSRFLRKLTEDDNKSECLLPDMAEYLIENRSVFISAYPTDCRWFGLTYKEDALDAAWEIDKRHQDGTYPDKLF